MVILFGKPKHQRYISWHPEKMIKNETKISYQRFKKCILNGAKGQTYFGQQEQGKKQSKTLNSVLES